MESGPFSGVVVAAGLALLALPAYAADGQEVPPGYVDTPVGQVRESAIRGLCDIPVVFIGKVAERVHAVTGPTYLGPVVRIDDEVELPSSQVILDAWNDWTEKAAYCR